MLKVDMIPQINGYSQIPINTSPKEKSSPFLIKNSACFSKMETNKACTRKIFVKTGI